MLLILYYTMCLYVCRYYTILCASCIQICKQVVTRLSSSRHRDVFALLVPSCCDKSGTSCYHLVTRLMTVTDMPQVVPTILIQAVRNELLRACCHQLVNNLLRVDVQLYGISDFLEHDLSRDCWSHQPCSVQDDSNLFQTCQQLGTSGANTSC